MPQTFFAPSPTAPSLYTQGEYQSWSPTVVQSGALSAVTGNPARYKRDGNTIHFFAQITVSNATGAVAANPITISLPVPAKFTASAPITVGSGAVYDQSADDSFPGNVRLLSATTVAIQPNSTDNTTVSTSFYLGAFVFALALAANDIITIEGHYEAVN